MTDLRELDAIVNTSATLRRGAATVESAVAALDRSHLRALADRLELDSQRPSRELGAAIRRRLLGLPRAW